MFKTVSVTVAKRLISNGFNPLINDNYGNYFLNMIDYSSNENDIMFESIFGHDKDILMLFLRNKLSPSLKDHLGIPLWKFIYENFPDIFSKELMVHIDYIDVIRHLKCFMNHNFESYKKITSIYNFSKTIYNSIFVSIIKNIFDDCLVTKSHLILEDIIKRYPDIVHLDEIFGKTYLYFVVQCEYYESMIIKFKLLVNNGVDPFKKDLFGKRPFDYFEPIPTPLFLFLMKKFKNEFYLTNKEFISKLLRSNDNDFCEIIETCSKTGFKIKPTTSSDVICFNSIFSRILFFSNKLYKYYVDIGINMLSTSSDFFKHVDDYSFSSIIKHVSSDVSM